MMVTGAAIITSTGLRAELASNADAVSVKLQVVAEQISSGLVSTTYAGLGGGALTSLDLRPQIARNDALVSGLSAATAQMSVTQSVMTRIDSLSRDVFATLTANQGGAASAIGIDAIATKAREAFDNITTLLNTRDGDSYIFSGQDSANPPVPSTAGFVAGVTSAVQALGTGGTTLAATEAASLGASTATVFSSAQGQGTPQSVETGQGAPVAYGVSAGTSYMRQMLQSLASIGALTGAQTAAAGYSSFVQDTLKQLGSASTALETDQGSLGERQAALTATQTAFTGTKISLTTQLSGVEDADVTMLATTQSLLQTQLQTSYKLIANMQNLSLVSYL